ncbi:MAG TPA: LuxR C-terminal-related transcriptional regulator [Candidatus Acidoferrales bacterium]|nr:LuxR C-terminal-related transcriptional regulator [Candidatus Acidoferrales bacterium]
MASAASATAKTEPIRILVTDNTPMGADLLARTLKRDRRFHVVGTIVIPDEILETARRDKPDVVILTHLDEESPIRFRTARDLRASLPSQKLVILLDSSERSLVVEAFRAGARGILCRDASVKSLGKCLESVHEGQIWATSAEMQFVLESLVESPPIRLSDPSGTPLLTNQEQAVVHWMTEGLSNREIASQLKLSEHTVKNYIFRVFEKLGVSKRVEVILYALNQRAHSRDGNSHRPTDTGPEDRLLFQWSRMQAEQGSAPAAFLLAQMCRDGRGTKRDLVSAYSWFLTAQAGSEEFRDASRLACEILARAMTPEQIMTASSRVAGLRGAVETIAPQTGNVASGNDPAERSGSPASTGGSSAATPGDGFESE